MIWNALQNTFVFKSRKFKGGIESVFDCCNVVAAASILMFTHGGQVIVPLNRPVSHSARHQRPARERHIMRIASRENVDNQAPRNTNFTQ